MSTADENQMKAKLADNDIIYVTGGNTFFLLQEMKRTGADILIKNEINSGKIYIGESAGAIITAPNIKYISSMDSIKKAPNLSSYEGLGIVDFYILPHYLNSPFKKITSNIVEQYSTILTLQPISNNEVILVKGSKVTIKKLM